MTAVTLQNALEEFDKLIERLTISADEKELLRSRHTTVMILFENSLLEQHRLSQKQADKERIARSKAEAEEHKRRNPGHGLAAYGK